MKFILGLRDGCAIVGLVTLVSCAALQRVATPTHTIDALTVGPLMLNVCDQHDELVARDAVFVQAEKDQALRSTAMLRAIVGEAMQEPAR